MNDVYKKSLALYKKTQGVIKTEGSIQIKNRKDLSIAYTPGVAEVSRAIAKNKKLSFDLTWRGRTVAIISDGSAVLGLGNIGAEAALPVMEGKALLLKKFAGVESVPIVVNSQDPQEIIHFIKNISSSFAGINLEDVAAPACFQIEEALDDIGIPVFHDDQHGTAIVASAALRNAAKVVGKPYGSLKVVIVGAGSAGLATARMLLGLNCSADICEIIPGHPAVADVIVVDRKGALYSGREDQNIYKQAVAGISNKERVAGSLEQIIKDSDVIIGLAGKKGLITKNMVKNMARDPIIFAMGNPEPEILPDDAYNAGASVIATGRSDFPNQINNVLAYPGIFKAVVRAKLPKITQEMKDAAADALAKIVKNPTSKNIIPDVFHPNLSEQVAKAVIKTS